SSREEILAQRREGLDRPHKPMSRSVAHTLAILLSFAHACGIHIIKVSMDTGLSPLLTREEYLAFERRSETKHEYVAGEVLPMANATRRHSRIQMAALTSLNIQLRDRHCEVFPSDMRVTISALGIYTYPDITVVCGDSEVEDEVEDTLLNPTVIIEVLS